MFLLSYIFLLYSSLFMCVYMYMRARLMNLGIYSF